MRYSSIDVLRTTAIFVMVIVHFIENLSGVGEWSPDGFGAPLFTFLTGMSYRLWLSGQEFREKEDSEISKVTVRRGLFLFGLGFVFNAFVWLPEDLFTWDVLTFIGASLIVLNVVRKLLLPLSLLLIVLSLAISPVLQTLADYPAYWVEGYFECEQTLSDVILGFLVTGYFPIFPWIAFPVSGFVVASLIFRKNVPAAGLGRSTVITGGALLAISATAVLGRWYAPNIFPKTVLTGWSMFPASPEYVSGTLGMTLLLFTFCHRWIDQNPRFGSRRGVLSVASTFSRYSLSIYLCHHIIHIWPLWIYGMAMQQDPTHYYGNAFPYGASLMLALAFIVCCYFVLRWIERSDKPTIESWMRWICD